MHTGTHPKNMKIACAKVPQRAPTISNQVWAYGAFNFNFAASFWRFFVRKFNYILQITLLTDLCKKKDLDCSSATIPPRSRDSIFVRDSTGLKLRRTDTKINLRDFGYLKKTHQSCCPCPSRHYARSNETRFHAASYRFMFVLCQFLRKLTNLLEALLNSSEFLGENPV